MNSFQNPNQDSNDTNFKLPDFLGFLEQSTGHKVQANLEALKNSKIYELCSLLHITTESLARYFAEFCRVDFYPYINPEEVDTEILPAHFSKAHGVVPIKKKNNVVFVLSYPFNRELLDMLKMKTMGPFSFAIAPPQAINFVLVDDDSVEISYDKENHRKLSEQEEDFMPNSNITHIADNLLQAAVQYRASDIHIEPKELHTLVRFRIDGEMKEVYAIKTNTGNKLISRFKVFGGLDIAEKRKPQDGIVEAQISGKNFKLRLATTSTPKGESMVIRLLDQSSYIPALEELGLFPQQSEALMRLARREQGMILIVGVTGSGKTTTIYSLLSQIDCRNRSLISVEDPVEYRIPFANQQQVNEKAKITFETILKSSVRQDPDVLFLGEIRDAFSAKVGMDFASTGHLMITTLHTSNATTAIFRLERLEITRDAMADSVIAIIAQRLLKKLCDNCKEIAEPSSEEIKMLKGFVDEIPGKIARPRGCPKCAETGYWGREGVYEILEITPEMELMIRAHKSIAEIRNFAQRSGAFLISRHAVEKVKQLKFSVEEVYGKILVEEDHVEAVRNSPEVSADPVKNTETFNPFPKRVKFSVLLVEDDRDDRELIMRYLENAGYEVTVAEDGVDALLCLGKKAYDLILSDVNMPNLNGFKLIEMAHQKGISAPILLMTSHSDDETEQKSLELGAADYFKKPLQKNLLLLRIENILKSRYKLSA